MASKIFRVLTLTMILLAVVSECSPAALNNTKNYKHFNPFQKMEAENYSTASDGIKLGACETQAGDDYVVYGLAKDSWLKYDDVDFEENGAQVFSIRLISWYVKGIISIVLRLDTTTGQEIGSLQVNYTGGQCSQFQIFSTYLDIIPTETQTLVLTFPSEAGNNLDLDYFYFNRTM